MGCRYQGATKPYKGWTATSRWWTSSPNKRRLTGACGGHWANRWCAAWTLGRRHNGPTFSGCDTPTEQGDGPSPAATLVYCRRSPRRGLPQGKRKAGFGTCPKERSSGSTTTRATASSSQTTEAKTSSCTTVG